MNQPRLQLPKWIAPWTIRPVLPDQTVQPIQADAATPRPPAAFPRPRIGLPAA